MKWNDLTILLTGGTGSLGQKFLDVILTHFNPKIVRVFSRDELKQYELSQKYQGDERLRYFIGDVRDSKRLDLAMKGVDIVIHAAAMKQVPLCEYNPFEAIKTNIMGTENVIRAAMHHGVKKMMAISSDKAVNPINLYGATKLCAEKLTIRANYYSGANGTKFSCCRYGNVLGSRGSVLSVFKEQSKNGTLSITDRRMTRFWVTLDDVARFIISSTEKMIGGEIFIPKMSSMKVIDLARLYNDKLPIKEIGIRPGEKIHEVLIAQEEAKKTLSFKDCFIIVEPEFYKENSYLVEGEKVQEDFFYRSDTNKEWFSAENLSADLFR